jgi:mRNA interferase MazF
MVSRPRSKYIPERGDIVWIDFSPHRAREQADRRPAIVLSPAKYNRQSALVLVCPITSKQKGYPFEVEIIAERIRGVALTDQLRIFDWRVRQGIFVDRLDYITLRKIQKRAIALIVM